MGLSGDPPKPPPPLPRDHGPVLRRSRRAPPEHRKPTVQHFREAMPPPTLIGYCFETSSRSSFLPFVRGVTTEPQHG